MVLDLEAALFGDFDLALFDLGVVELLDVAALHAHDMVVVPALLQLENRFAGFEMVADEQPRLLELREHAINRREPGVGAFLEQQFCRRLPPTGAGRRFSRRSRGCAAAAAWL